MVFHGGLCPSSLGHRLAHKVDGERREAETTKQEHTRMMKGTGMVVGTLLATMFFNQFTYGMAILVCIVLAAVALLISIKPNT